MLAPTAGLLNWAVAHAGAGNPIGNLRVKEAADWLAANAGPLRGFTDDEVAQRGDKFAEHLASHGLFVAGSAGVQGEWPKVLLTRARRALFASTTVHLDARTRIPSAYLTLHARSERPRLLLASQNATCRSPLPCTPAMPPPTALFTPVSRISRYRRC